ncbi:MAG: TetR family transcriptional regulator [Acidimicrobiales bacterium]
MAQSEPVPQRILTAALEVSALHGIARLSVGDVAQRAGLSRQTLYKYFSSKQELVAAVVQREAATIAGEVVAAVDSHEDPRDALEAGVLAALRATRDHPLLDRLVRAEPEALLPLLVSDTGPVMLLVRSVVEVVVASKAPDLGPFELRRHSDMLTRLLISYAVSAPDDPPELVAASVADVFVNGMLATSPAR